MPDGDDSFEPLDAHGTMAFGMMLRLYMADGYGSGIEEKLKLLLNTPNGLTIASQLIINFVKEGDASKAECLTSDAWLLGAYMDYGQVEKGISLYEKIAGLVEPDRFIMSAAVHLYQSVGMEPKSEDILKSMKSLGISFLDNLVVGSKAQSV
ncbi:hypothetical protein ACET3Z_027753 [Daucus carota]